MATLDLSTGLLLVAISLFSAVSVVMLGGLRPNWWVQRQKPGAAAPLLANVTDRTLLVFEQGRLSDATPPALLFIKAPVDQNAVWAALCKKLADDFPGAPGSLRDIAAHGGQLTLGAGQPYSVKAWVDETSRLLVEIFDLRQSPAAAPGALSPPEPPVLQAMADLSPVLMWEQDKSGKVIWANRPYTDLLARMFPDQPIGTPPFPVILGPPLDQHASSRSSATPPGQTAPMWFEVTSHPRANGASIHFAIHADPVVKAEQALRNFIQTLTKTFAHLPIGLAIFDRDRQLALFNPALADLTTLDPVWLSTRPSLYAFLDRLRENRRLPEPKDYKTWRHQIAELERAAADGTYEENWSLPTGQTFRVSGRPHPEGAVAFLFEDISSAIALQRQFRSELALGQSVLDSEPDAIAVFSANGDLVMSNDAYATLWGVDPHEMLARITLEEAIRDWNIVCFPRPAEGDALLFANNPASRLRWSDSARLKTGGTIKVEVAPLAQGAIVYRFSVHAQQVPARAQKSLVEV